MLNYKDSDMKLKEFGQVKICSRYDLAMKLHHDIDSNIVQTFLALFSGGLSKIYSMWSSLFTLIADPEASPTWKAWCHDLKPHSPHANGYSWKLYCINSKILCFAVAWRFKKNNTPTVKLLAEQETTKIPGCKGQPSAVGGLANGWPDVPTAPRGDGIPWHVGLQVSLRRYDQYSMVNPQELGHNSSIMLDILW